AARHNRKTHSDLVIFKPHPPYRSLPASDSDNAITSSEVGLEQELKRPTIAMVNRKEATLTRVQHYPIHKFGPFRVMHFPDAVLANVAAMLARDERKLISAFGKLVRCTHKLVCV